MRQLFWRLEQRRAGLLSGKEMMKEERMSIFVKQLDLYIKCSIDYVKSIWRITK